MNDNEVDEKHFNEGDKVKVRFPLGDVKPAIYWKRSAFANLHGIRQHIVKPIDQPDMRYFGQFDDEDIWPDGEESQS